MCALVCYSPKHVVLDLLVKPNSFILRPIMFAFPFHPFFVAIRWQVTADELFVLHDEKDTGRCNRSSKLSPVIFHVIPKKKTIVAVKIR